MTIACVFVQGEYPYTVDYVTRLRDMVARWTDRPFRFVCLTDQPQLFTPPIETVWVAKLPGFAPWTKLELFNPIRQWTGRMLYFDLDTLIVAPLAPIIDAPTEFAITADPTNKKNRTCDSFGRAIVRRFNSSVMVWDGGTQTDLYTNWTTADGDRLSGDQDWIGERRPSAVTMPREWFPRLSELGGQPPVEPSKVVLVKVPKNHLAAAQYPWFGPLWGAI
jgi:hypothetical protein